jgi:hypothetical protein
MSSFKQRVRRARWFNAFVQPARDRAKRKAWFKSSKGASPPLTVKWNALLYWADAIGATTFVETGTHTADTARELNERFERYVTIEIMHSFASQAALEFSGRPNVEVIHGDSAVELPKVVETLTGPTVFWLDAHWAGPGTGGKSEDGMIVPVETEFSSVAQTKHPHVIAIDDIRCFDGVTGGYPTVEAVRDLAHRLGYWVTVVDDMLIAVPAAVIEEGLPAAANRALMPAMFQIAAVSVSAFAS